MPWGITFVGQACSQEAGGAYLMSILNHHGDIVGGRQEPKTSLTTGSSLGYYPTDTHGRVCRLVTCYQCHYTGPHHLVLIDGRNWAEQGVQLCTMNQ